MISYLDIIMMQSHNITKLHFFPWAPCELNRQHFFSLRKDASIFLKGNSPGSVASIKCKVESSDDSVSKYVCDCLKLTSGGVLKLAVNNCNLLAAATGRFQICQD